MAGICDVISARNLLEALVVEESLQNVFKRIVVRIDITTKLLSGRMTPTAVFLFCRRRGEAGYACIGDLPERLVFFNLEQGNLQTRASGVDWQNDLRLWPVRVSS
jgi:hypothetical protein